jgi:hypothetical protein
VVEQRPGSDRITPERIFVAVPERRVAGVQNDGLSVLALA